jgi:hypothetical protein
MLTPEEEVDAMLNDCETGRKGVVESNTKLAAGIVSFLDAKANGDERAEHVSLNWFYPTKLRPAFGGPKTLHTIRAFIREVLKRDPSTGLPL